MNSAENELFQIVDENDQVIGVASRRECHGNPSLIHRTVHVVVFNDEGKILLQKRSLNKDIQPGKWDTAVGGHLSVGESYEDAAKREFREELGADCPQELKFLFNSKIRNKIESENTKVFSVVHNGPFNPDKNEITELKFWSQKELKENIGRGIFTPNLEAELEKLFDMQI